MKGVFLAGLLLLTTFAANAQQQWHAGVMSENEGVYAGVTNDNGVIFGRYCYFKDNSCVWLLANNLTCKPGEDYPALATARTSAHVTLACGGKSEDNQYTRYFLKPFDTVEALVLEGGTLGVAVVADSGNFRVFRFDLRGAKAILDQADAIYRARSRTKDQVL